MREDSWTRRILSGSHCSMHIDAVLAKEQCFGGAPAPSRQFVAWRDLEFRSLVA